MDWKREIKLRRRQESKPPTERKEKKRNRWGKRAGPARGARPLASTPLMRAFNLLPKEDASVARPRRFSTAQLVLAVVALLVPAAFGSAFVLLDASVNDKRAKHEALRAQLAVVDKRASEREEAKQEQEETDPARAKEVEARTTALAGALGSRVAWDRLLREFSLVLPDDVWLTNLATAAPAAAAATDSASTTTPGVGSFTIKGYTYRQEGVARLLARLAVIPELTHVRLESSTRAEVGGREVFQFSISAAVSPGGGGKAS